MNAQYEPELDFDLLRDWCAFCEGVRVFSDDHFSTILMGVFLGGLTPEVDRFLREFAKSFPPSLYDNLVRICGGAEHDRDVLPWVHRDLDEKRKLLTSSPECRDALRVIDERRFTITQDHDLLHATRVASGNHSFLYQTVGDFVIEHCQSDTRFHALHEALYHIATDNFVADAIISPLLKTDINLSHYFEIYLRGSDYVLDADRIVMYTWQPEEIVSS
jgi:hypothetical protein